MDSYVGISFILNAFSIIECNYEVIDLSILIMYDVQYDVIAYESKIIWIQIFANLIEQHVC